MEISCACVDFFRLSMTISADRDNDKNGFMRFTDRMCSLNERRKIKTSAQKCQLCQLIYNVLDVDYGPAFDLPDGENQHLVKMGIMYSCLNGDEKRISSIFLPCHEGNIHFAVWADKQTPASANFVTWAPILEDSAAQTTELVRTLLYDCLDHHEGCKLRGRGGEFDLPSRVLSIEEDTGNVSVKLVENTGFRGRYCALSHCWGSEDRLPLRTTKKNFKDHLVSIPWGTLPPLFQDAIKLTSSLGIKYLWIDSLCIVQDDEQDWYNEAKRMSSVYRTAVLVIAAVDSTDSTQRLSKAKRPDPVTVRVPYYTQEGAAQGSYNVAASSSLNGSVSGPLIERGWVFQELYLGRRKVLFTSEGLLWKCGEFGMNERGNYSDLEMYETNSWLDCLDEYSRRHLTYPSDRIDALLGIVQQIGESRSDSFVSKYGVWQDQLVEQLLWRSVETQDDDLPGQPSWSWAATGGAKIWQTLNDLHEVVIDKAAQTVQLTESGSLRASGVLLRTAVAPLPMLECCLEHYLQNTRTRMVSRSYIEDCVLPGYAGSIDDLVKFPILNATDTGQILGLATFDRWEYTSACFCFILASTSRDVGDPCHPDFDKRLTTSGEDAWTGIVHRDSDECVDIFELGRGVEVYWALLLYPVDEALTRFKRVGLALLWPQALETEDGEFKEFEIV